MASPDWVEPMLTTLSEAAGGVVREGPSCRRPRGDEARRRARGPAPRSRAYFAGRIRLPLGLRGSFWLETGLLLADITFVSNAICPTWLANALDTKVITFGSLLERLSHHRNGLSTQPPSVLGMRPS